MKLIDRTAVVTGAGSGIGRAIAQRFAAEGARVVVAELHASAGESTVETIRSAGGKALAVATDVTDRSAVAKLFEAVDAADWQIDYLINNAGNAEEGLQPIHEVSDERWHGILRVHLDGTFYCLREALRRMIPRRQGSIINLGSVAGLRGLGGTAAYSAAKGGILSLTKAVAEECAPHGIRVNCIAPGWIETPMLDSLPARWRPGMVRHTPVGRLGKPEEIAALALFLASDESSFITGQIISPNGGMYRW